MRYAANVDKNQAAIIQALEGIGCTVQRLSAVGKSVPDLLVGVAGVNLLIEVKNQARKGGKENAHGTLKKQREWRQQWRGSVYVATTPEEAVEDVRRYFRVFHLSVT
jgi:Holliday junction resolvase